MKWIAVIIITMLIILKYIEATIDRKHKKIDYSKCYQPRFLLTMNEWYEYNKLYEYAKNMIIVYAPRYGYLILSNPGEGIRIT